MGWITLDDDFIGDAPYRSLGTGNYGNTTAFDAYALATMKPKGSDADVWAYAERKMKMKLIRQAARRFRDDAGGHLDWMRVVGKEMVGLAYKPIRYVVAVLEHERDTGAGRRHDVILNAALLYARYARRQQRAARQMEAAE